MRTRLFLATVLLSVPVMAGAQSSAAAQARGASEARCDRLRAQAQSQAFVLASPTLWLEGVHVPNVGDETGMALVQGGEWQLRSALSWSPLDVARGVMLVEQSATECRALQAATRLRRAMQLGSSFGELEAQQAERAALEASMDEVDALEREWTERVLQGLGTTVQLNAIAAERVRLQRRLATLAAEIQRLEALADTTPLLDEDLSHYEAAAFALEAQRSSLRRLAPWTVQVRAGIVPASRVDWFGQLQVGFNLGGIAQHIAEDELLEARRNELAGDADELRAQVERFARQLRLTLPGIEAERTHVEQLIQLSLRQLAALEQLETSEVAHLRAMTRLGLLALQAEAARWTALFEARRAAVGEGEEAVAATDGARTQ